ncbi:hypothetical protein ACFV30_07960 [Streptomyces sp. NPDC059752]|uniref:hypothetical protein n=1 Tax=unclassified Streptomyces TaxID=2593676 RepID=UPI0036468FEC
MGSHEDLADDRAALLVRDAMDRATAELPALTDLAGPARAQGLRRRARVRAGIGGAVVAVAALSVAGALALPGDDGARSSTGSTGVAAAPGVVAQPPVHIDPTPGETSMADLPPAERARQEDFQNRAVAALQGLLPEAVGTVQRTDLTVSLYRGTKDGRTFDVVFSVRPSDTAAERCREIKGTVCTTGTLPDGTEVDASTSPVDSGAVTASRVWFRYGTSNVSLTVHPHEPSNTSAPVTGAQLLELAKAPVFLDLVKTADQHPMEAKHTLLPAGD